MAEKQYCLPHIGSRNGIDSTWFQGNGIRSLSNLWLLTKHYIVLLPLLAGVWAGYCMYKVYVCSGNVPTDVFLIAGNMFLPVLCCLVFCIIYWIRINGTGRELFSLYQKKDGITYGIGYITVVLVLCLVLWICGRDIENPGYVLLQLMIVALGYYAMCYGIAFVFRNMMPAWIVVFAVYVTSLTPYTDIFAVGGCEVYDLASVLQATWEYIAMAAMGMVLGLAAEKNQV